MTIINHSLALTAMYLRFRLRYPARKLTYDRWYLAVYVPWKKAYDAKHHPVPPTPPVPLTFRAKVLATARGELGVREWPAGSNWGPEVKQFLAAAGIGSAAPWCAAFVTWVLKHSGYHHPLPVSPGYCPSWYQLAAKNGLLKNKLWAKAGDIVLFQWGDNKADHIGFILSNFVAGHMVSTLEGNAGGYGGEVATHARYIYQEYAVIDLDKLHALQK